MSNTALICRKELRRCFATPIGWSLVAASVVLFTLACYAVGEEPLRRSLSGPVFALSGFTPARELADHPVTLVLGFARVEALYLMPLISMRLFIEEKQTRTIEMLFTSPVLDPENILGKWLGATLLFLAIVGVSVAEFAVWFRHHPDWATLAIIYAGLVLPGVGVLALGECLSMWNRHQAAAALGTLFVSLVVFRVYRKGVLAPADFGFCAALVLAGWLLTWRSIQSLRGNL